MQFILFIKYIHHSCPLLITLVVIALSEKYCPPTPALGGPYLLTQLPGGAHDDGDGAVPGLQLLLVHDVHQHGPDEGRRLTAARLGDADHVASGQRYGHALKGRPERTSRRLGYCGTLHFMN